MDRQILGFSGIVKDVDANSRTLVALVSTDVTDRMGEVLDPKGADLKNFKKNPVVLFAHDHRQPPIGRAQWIKKSVNGILAKVEFAKTQLAEDVFQLFSKGFMRAFSVGFLPKEWVDGDGNKAPRRTFTKWELLEFSAVPVPANPEALALALKEVKSEVLIKVLKGEKKNEKKEDLKKSDEDIAEYIMTLESEIENLKKLHENNLKIKDGEIADLKYKIYLLTVKRDATPETVSEMTGDQITKMIEDSISGVIRQVTGKVS